MNMLLFLQASTPTTAHEHIMETTKTEEVRRRIAEVAVLSGLKPRDYKTFGHQGDRISDLLDSPVQPAIP